LDLDSISITSSCGDMEDSARILLLGTPTGHKPVFTPGTSFHVASFVVNATRHYMAYRASIFRVFRVGQPSEGYVVMVFHRVGNAGRRLLVFTIPAATFTFSHQIGIL